MRGQDFTNNEFEEKIIQISRVSKKTKGGNKIGFSVLMVVGDKKGQVGVGLGKAPDVAGSIRKGVKRAKKRMIMVPLDGTTIPFPIKTKCGAGYVMLKPAPRGSGVIAGGPVRAVVEAAGIRDISTKILGTENQASNAYTAFAALKRIQTIVAIKGIALKSIAEVEAEEEQKLIDEMEKSGQRRQQSMDTRQRQPNNQDRQARRRPFGNNRGSGNQQNRRGPGSSPVMQPKPALPAQPVAQPKPAVSAQPVTAAQPVLKTQPVVPPTTQPASTITEKTTK